MKIGFLLVTCTFLSVASPAFAASTRPLNADDYLCTIFPPGCPKVVKSQDLNLVYIELRGGKVKAATSDAPAQRTIAVPRAFIDWAPYLKPEPQWMVALEAAIPDFGTPVLVPDVAWKAYARDSSTSEARPASDQDPHTHWIHVEVSIGGKSVTESISELRSTDFVREAPAADKLFRRYVPETKNQYYYQYENKQLLVPLGQTEQPVFLVCQVNASTTFNWCEAETTLEKDVVLRYQFETRQLQYFYLIDRAVREFVLKAFDRGRETQEP